MNRKIDKAKKKKQSEADSRALQEKGIEASERLERAIHSLSELLNGQSEYDFKRLEKQLEKIDKSLDLTKYFTNLERSLKAPRTDNKTKIQDFSKLLKAVSDNKPLPVNIDLRKLEKAVVNIEQYIADQSQPSDQGAENYQPVRRVIKVGNRFIFDDNFSNAGGGGGSGGGGTTDGLTDAQLRATPVPVSGTVTATPTGTQNVDVTANTIGLATGTKQDTGNTSVASIDTKTPALGQALAAASTPVVLPAAQITTLTPPAAITGFATSAKQDTLLTELQLKADLTETQPVSLASVPSHAVTNAGTFAVQNTAALPAGTNNIGDVDVLSLPALPAGTNAIGKLSANSGVDIGDVDVTSSVSATLDHGSNLDIDTTAEQITTTSFSAKFGVTVKSAVDNTGTVYIGNSDVTAGTTAATDGFPLEPGESITLPVNNSNLLYAIGAAANQKVFWSAV